MRKIVKAIILIVTLTAVFCTAAVSLAADDVRITVSSYEPTELSTAGTVSVKFDISNFSTFNLTNLSLKQGDTVYPIDSTAQVPAGGSIQMVVPVAVTDAQIGNEIPFSFGWMANGQAGSATASITITRASDPVLILERTVSSQRVKRGSQFTVTYTLRNNSKFDITDIVLTDSAISSEPICRSLTVYAQGSNTFEYPATAGEKDIVSSPEATYFVNGKAKTLSNVQPITVSVVYPALEITAEAGQADTLGTPISIQVKNTGNMPLTSITIKDENGSIVIPETFSLNAGESRSLSYTAPNPTTDLRNLHLTATGTDEFGDSCQGALVASIPIYAYVDDSQIQVTINGTVTSDFNAETGSVSVRLSIINNSSTPLKSATLTETSLGTLATYETLNNGQTVYENELYISTPRNLYVSIQATDRAGNIRNVAESMLEVVATDTTSGGTTGAGFGANFFDSGVSKILVILGAIVIIALSVLLILTILEKSHRSILTDTFEDEEEMDEMDRIFDLPPGEDYGDKHLVSRKQQQYEEEEELPEDYDGYYYETDDEDEAPDFDDTIVVRRRATSDTKPKKKRVIVYEDDDDEDDWEYEEVIRTPKKKTTNSTRETYYEEEPQVSHPKVIKVKREPGVRTEKNNKIRRVKPYEKD